MCRPRWHGSQAKLITPGCRTNPAQWPKRTVTNLSCQLGRSPFLISICRCGCSVLFSFPLDCFLFYLFFLFFFCWFAIDDPHKWRRMSIDIVVWSAELPGLSLLNIKINYHKWTSLITRVSFSTLPQYMQNYTVYVYVFIYTVWGYVRISGTWHCCCQAIRQLTVPQTCLWLALEQSNYSYNVQNLQK